MYFDGQGTQKLPCGKIPGGGWRGRGYRLAHGLVALGLLITVAVQVISSYKSYLFLVLFRFIGCEPVWPNGKA